MDVSCFGFSDGAIEVSATGGYESYTFSIHPDIGTQSPAGTFHGLTSGMFLINAFNDNGEPCRPLEVKLEEPHQSITILEQPRDQTDCYGNTVSFFVTVAGFSGIPLYQWQQRPPGGNFTDIIDANSPVLTIHDIGVKGMNIDGTQYRVLVTDNCHTLISMEALLRINSITNLIPQAVNRTICSGETITYEVLTQGEVVRNGYQWSWNNGTGWIALSDDEVYLGTSTSRLTISNASPLQSGQYRVTVTFRTLNQPGVDTCVRTSTTRQRHLIVLEEIVAPIMPEDQEVCYNTIPLPLIASESSGGSNSFVYQWQSSPNGVTNWINIEGETNLTYYPELIHQTTYYRLIATDAGNIACGIIFSKPVSIVVNPVSEPGTVLAENTTICSGMSTTLMLSGYHGTIVWQQSSDGIIWSNNSGGDTSNTSTFTTPTLFLTTYFRANVTSGNCSPALSNVIEVLIEPSVVPSVVISAFPSNTICEGAFVTFISTATNGGSEPLYQWQLNDVNVSGQTAATFTTSTLVNGDQVRVVMRSSDYCSDTETVASNSITVNAVVMVTPTFTQINPRILNSDPLALPLISSNGIPGTWNPPIIDTQIPGTFMYTFTPEAGHCATIATMNISIIYPELAITKTAAESSYSYDNAILHYTIMLSNDGFMPFTDILITDPLTGLSQTIGTLLPGEDNAATIETSYTVTQADLDAGLVYNTVTASTIYDNTEITVTDDETVYAAQRWSIEVTKTASQTTYSSAGEVITYTVTIRNTGNVTLTGVTVNDPLITLTYISGDLNTDGNLDVNETWTFRGTYSITLDDIDYRLLVNRAYGQALYGDNVAEDSDELTITAEQLPSLSVSKVVYQAVITAPTTLNYTITIANTGNVSLTGIIVRDDFAGGAYYESGDLNENGVLDIGEVWIYSASHEATQADVNAGEDLVNIVIVNTDQTASVQDIAVTTINREPALIISKVADRDSYSEAVETVIYTIVITNTGNVTLTDIRVTDPMTSLNELIGELLPGSSESITTTYVVSQNDVNSGQIVNTATARYIFAGATYFASDSETITAIQTADWTLTKSTTVTSFVSPGEVIDYEITVTNTGNVTITGVVVNDPNADVTCAGAPYTLAPGAGVTCTATHTVTASDVAEGSISNTATATAFAQNSDPVTGVSNNVIVPLNNLPPVISCPEPIATSTSDTSCDILISEGLSATFSDPNDNITSLTWTMTGATVAESDDTGINNITTYTYNLGETTLTYTVTDALGLSASCSFTVTVTDDTPPVAICRDITVVLDINTGTATITPDDINNNSFDNCGIATMTINITDFDYTNLGPNYVTLTLTDNSGNISTCTAIVTVNYAVDPAPVVTPDSDIICNGETINLELTSQIPAIKWTWTVNSPAGITGAEDDPGGLNSTISQTIYNSTRIAHQLIYNIRPRVYGACELEHIIARVWVNPIPEIRIGSNDTILCYGDATVINVRNMNPMVRGQWVYELIVTPDEGVHGYTESEIFANDDDLVETLTNSTRQIKKVEYRFIPRIVTGDGSPDCIGEEKTISIHVYPEVDYTTEISDYNSYNISCYGYSNGFIRISPNPDAAPYTFIWTGPNGFRSEAAEISGLKAGIYTMTITDANGCSVSETFELTEPDLLGMTITTSVSNDGNYNINCDGGKTGSISIEAHNNVGPVQFLWIDGFIGSERNDLIAGNYRIILIDANFCTAESSVTLTDPDPIRLSFEMTQPYCDGTADGEVRLTVTGGIEQYGYTFLWSDGSTEQNLSNARSGVYTVAVTDANGCTTVGSVEVGFTHEHCLIIPEAISPNGDLINDVWNIGNIEVYPEVVIRIYNRWGQALWQSEPGYPRPWDGRSNGRVLPIDAYHYTIDIKNGYKLIIGTVTIVDI